MSQGHAPKGRICNCNLRGWMPGIEHIPIEWTLPSWIRNDRGKMRPYLMVDHIAQGFISTIDDWAVRGGSKIITHFGVSRSGRRVQYMDIYTEGIHTSSVNSPSSKIVQRLGSVAHRGANSYSIATEHEGFSIHPGSYQPDYIYSSRGRGWPMAMVEASLSIKEWCFAQPDTNLGEPSVDTIIGHYEADLRNREHDPAWAEDRQVWPRDWFVKMAKAAPKPKPEEGYVDRDYTLIRKGEWMTKVSQRVGITVAELCRINNIANASEVEAWQSLRLHEGVPMPEQRKGLGQQDVQDLASAMASVSLAGHRLELIAERNK
jgi:hypothetical protein